VAKGIDSQKFEGRRVEAGGKKDYEEKKASPMGEGEGKASSLDSMLSERRGERSQRGKNTKWSGAIIPLLRKGRYLRTSITSEKGKI